MKDLKQRRVIGASRALFYSDLRASDGRQAALPMMSGCGSLEAADHPPAGGSFS
jgi:hypothetical protein